MNATIRCLNLQVWKPSKIVALANDQTFDTSNILKQFTESLQHSFDGKSCQPFGVEFNTLCVFFVICVLCRFFLGGV